MSDYKVYILECADGSLYTGQTKNLEKRMKQHKNGQGSKYVSSRLPFKLRYSETHETRSDAMKRENEIKKWQRDRKLELINDAS